MAGYRRDVYLCWLASAGLSPAALRNLLEAAGDGAEPLASLLDAVSRGERAPGGAQLPDGALRLLRRNGAARMLDAWAQQTESYGIRAWTIGDADYPEALVQIPEPPAILFYSGTALSGPGRRAAIVGSRNAGWKGLKATEKIAAGLSEAGVSVISGLAYGIDAAAHRGCLKGGSPTIAVMGCGLDQDYPAENAGLKKEILDRGGLVISEYAPGEKPLGWHFPVRNRIISGLAGCVILMEARIRSGSMTTVQHALDQGRDVFVYPGEPDSLKSEGNHQLLREGAIYFTTAEDILEDMRWLDKKKEVRQNSDEVSRTSALTETERAILQLLRRGSMSLDELCEAMKAEAGPMMARLTMMQIAGLIEALPGKQYVAKEE